MVKIGSILLFFIGTVTAAITLKVVDEDGRPASNQITVGVPFRVELKFDQDNGNVMPEPAVFAPAVILGQSTQSFVAITNGKRSMSKSYIYTLRIDSEGDYKLGPISIKMPDRSIETSNKLMLKATRDTIKKSNDIADIILQTDTLAPYVGQEINMRLRLESAASIVVEKNVLTAPVQNIEILPWQEPAQERNKNALVINWYTKAYAQFAGTITIPAMQISYVMPRSGFMAFAPWQSAKAGYSNAVTLNVRPLPPFDKPINAIGIIDEFAVTTPKKRVEHAAIIKVEVYGASGLNRFVPNQLVLPEGLKYYQGAVQHTPGKKTIEYIVQAQQAGEYIIPAQEIVYFDTMLEKYVHLKSEPLTITFTVAAPESVPVTIDVQLEDMQKNVALKSNNNAQLLSDLLKAPYVKPLKKRFLLLMLSMPLMLLGLQWIAAFYRRKTDRFRKMRAIINAAQMQKNLASLAPAFIELTASRDINSLLASNTQRAIQWQQFFERIQAAAYSNVSHENVHEIIKEAYEWSAYFERNTRYTL